RSASRGPTCAPTVPTPARSSPSRSSPKRGCLSFFFSSRRRHTRFSRDWSSDVCSSDLGTYFLHVAHNPFILRQLFQNVWWHLLQIGRASCRERVCVAGVAGTVEGKI